MAYLCVDKNGQENIARYNPTRDNNIWVDEELLPGESEELIIDYIIELPEGSIKKLINKKLTWENEPFEIKTYG